MWDTIKSVLTSSNALYILIFLIVVILVISVLILTGKLKLNLKGIKVGSGDRERAIMQSQIEYVEYLVRSFTSVNPDTYRSRYIEERIYDEMVKWIIFDVIDDSKEYVALKQELIWALIQSLTTVEAYRTDTFKEEVYTQIEAAIKRLISIRKNYKGRK